jgi:hypothetical protein
VSDKKPASEGELGTLHALMTEQFRKLLAGEIVRKWKEKDSEGNEVEKEEVLVPTAAELSVIRAFLKDNEITAVANKGGALDELQKKLNEASGRGVRPALAAVESFDIPGIVQ